MSDPRSDATSPHATWKLLILIACSLVGLTIATVIGGKEANVRFAELHLTTSADHIRTQMDGSPAGQITRAAIPPNYADNVRVKWTTHRPGQWEACIDIGPRKPWHLIFTASSTYQVENGTCPAAQAAKPAASPPSPPPASPTTAPAPPMPSLTFPTDPTEE